MSELLNATLVERHDAGEHVALLRVRPDLSVLPSFEPGQFAMLGLPRPAPVPAASVEVSTAPARAQPRSSLVRRAYSIASAATERRWFEFCIRRVEDGRLTEALWRLGRGARLWMDGEIRGEFTLERAPRGASLLFVATGTGIGPFMSMLRTYHGTARWARCVLVHGARHASDLVYHCELEELVRSDPSLGYLPILSRELETSEWTGLRGRVQLALEDERVAPLLARAGPAPSSDTHVFLCGNPAMIQSVGAMLAPRGFRAPTRTEPGNLHFERYW